MSEFRDHAQIVTFYGVKNMADALGTSDMHVRQMRTRNSIPPAYWDDLVSDAKQRGLDGDITLEVLAKTAKSRFRQSREPAAA
jgi:hypothetical protein